MAISLNEGSFGLLMDPLNGAADIEARTLRLVSNYGFLEEPALLIRATRYIARLGWELDPRTQQRYENAKAENVIESLSAHDRSQELEQIGHEDDGLKVLRALEAEGWMKILCSRLDRSQGGRREADGVARPACAIADAGRAPRYVGRPDAAADGEDGAERSCRR